MPKRTTGARMNALCQCVVELATLVQLTLEIYCPDSEAAQERAKTVGMLAAGTIVEREGYPLPEDVPPEAIQEESPA